MFVEPPSTRGRRYLEAVDSGTSKKRCVSKIQL